MQEELHLMVDLETLGLKSSCVIMEVGYAIFETQANQINSSGVWKLHIQDQNQRTVDGGSLAWWSEQSDEARSNAFRSLPRISPISFLHEFAEQIDWHNIQGVWSHGLGFDIPILEDLHRQYGKLVPWHYRTPRDTRTLFWLADLSKTDWVDATLKHSAEADAIAQALTVQRALKKLADKS